MSSGNFLPMFLCNISGPYSGVKKILTPGDGTDRLSQKSVRNYHLSLRNNPEEGSSHLLRGGSRKSRIPLLSVDKCRVISVKVGDI